MDQTKYTQKVKRKKIKEKLKIKKEKIPLQTSGSLIHRAAQAIGR